MDFVLMQIALFWKLMMQKIEHLISIVLFFELFFSVFDCEFYSCLTLIVIAMIELVLNV